MFRQKFQSNIVMAGLDPATHSARVHAPKRPMRLLTQSGWMAGSVAGHDERGEDAYS